jgi:hypothetical protein
VWLRVEPPAPKVHGHELRAHTLAASTAAVQLGALVVGLGRVELEADRQHGVVRVQDAMIVSLHPDEAKDKVVRLEGHA